MSKRDKVKERLEFWREEFDDWREVLPADEFKAWYRGIAEHSQWGPVDRAGKFFGLDPTTPTNSVVLLRVLASILFAKPKKQGRKKGSNAWDSDRLIILGSRLHDLEAKAKTGSRMSDSEAARRLIKLYPEYGSEHQWITLRQRLPEARERFEVATISIEELETRRREEKESIDRMPLPQKLEAFAEVMARDMRHIHYKADSLVSLKKTRQGRKGLRRRHKEIEADNAELAEIWTGLEDIKAATEAVKKSLARKKASAKKKLEDIKAATEAVKKRLARKKASAKKTTNSAQPLIPVQPLVPVLQNK